MIRRILAVSLLAVALSVPQQVRADGFGFFGGCCSFYSGSFGGFNTWWYGQYTPHISYTNYWYQPTFYTYPTHTYDYPHDTQTPPGTSVPEPGTIALLGIGLLGLAYVAHRRRERFLLD